MRRKNERGKTNHRLWVILTGLAKVKTAKYITMLRIQSIVYLVFLLTSVPGWSKPFDFHDPKGFNSIEFSLLGAYENGVLIGKIGETSGYLDFDPGAPEKTSGKITVLTKSAQANSPQADAFLRGPSLFDAQRFPLISFVVDKTANFRRFGQSTQLDVVGELTIKGVTRKISFPAQLDYLPGKLEARRGIEGDLLVVQGEFFIKRSNFDIGAGRFLVKAADEVKIELKLIGAAPKKANKTVSPKSVRELLPLRSKSSRDTKQLRQRPLRQSSAARL